MNWREYNGKHKKNIWRKCFVLDQDKVYKNLISGYVKPVPLEVEHFFYKTKGGSDKNINILLRVYISLFHYSERTAGVVFKQTHVHWMT